MPDIEAKSVNTIQEKDKLNRAKLATQTEQANAAVKFINDLKAKEQGKIDFMQEANNLLVLKKMMCQYS